MDLQITIEVIKRESWYLARAPELDFVSQGKTSDEAKKNLLEVIQIQFKEMREMGTLGDYLEECGYEPMNDQLISHSEMMGFEKSVVSVS